MKHSSSGQCVKALFLFMLGAFLGGCAKEPPSAPPPPVVHVMTLEPQDITLSREWVGVMDGDVNATIRPQVTGYLVKQYYREGEFVKKNQVLFEIDKRSFKAALLQAQAVRNQQKAIYENAVLTLQRVRPLVQKNALSQKDLDDAVGRELSTRASLEQASAALEVAALNLEFTEIRSPISGIAGIAKAQMGDLLSPSATTELTTVSVVHPIKVYINISEREYLSFNTGKKQGRSADIPLELILVDGRVYPEKGEFSLLDRQVNPATGTFKVAARFPNPEGLLRPGQFGRVRAFISPRQNVLLVPQRAVMEIQGQYFMGVLLEGQKVDIRPVKMGERVGSAWLIEEGVRAGEQVIVEGLIKVRQGQLVTPKPFVMPPVDSADSTKKKAVEQSPEPASSAQKG